MKKARSNGKQDAVEPAKTSNKSPGKSRPRKGRRNDKLINGQPADLFYIAFRKSPDITIIADASTGKFIDANDNYVRTTGYSREELIGHTIDDFDLWVEPEGEAFTGERRIHQRRIQIPHEIRRNTPVALFLRDCEYQ
jgi:PAS domain-containing protein